MIWRILSYEKRSEVSEGKLHPTGSLRERKKNKTRAAIQQTALRLFAEQGYEATTIDQIADAVEISRATFFRYFPTKADIVLRDIFDPRVLQVYRSQPKGLNPLRVLRISLQSVFLGASSEELEDEKQRESLLRQTPGLRSAMLDMTIRALPILTQTFAEYVNGSIDDFSVRILAGATIGVILAIWETIPTVGDVNVMHHFWEQLDAGLAHLENAFSL